MTSSGELRAVLTRSGRCCSDLKLDRAVTGEMHAAERAELDAHLGTPTGAACLSRFAELTADHAAFVALPDQRARSVASFPVPVVPRATSLLTLRRALTGGVSLAAAAAVLFVIVRAPSDVDEVRAKGSGALIVHVLHDGVAREARRGEAVTPGDRLRFTLRSAAPAHVAVIGRDARGTVATYAPVAAGPLVRVGAGMEVEVDGSTELDDVLGVEELHAFFCDADQPPAALEAAVATSARDQLPAFSGCVVDRFHVVKARR